MYEEEEAETKAERKTRRLRTLRLAKKLVEGTRMYERVAVAKWVRNPLLRILRRTNRKRHEKLDVIFLVLTKRYKPTLNQLFQRAGITDDQIKAQLFAVLLTFRAELRTLSNYKGFSKSLWAACVSQAGADVPALKPKFMLRQFVDEIKAKESRDLLRALAYGLSDGFASDAEEAARLLEDAYAHLHNAVLDHCEDLNILTDGTLQPETISKLRKPFLEYQNWLFMN